ncbi:MAG: ATP-binding protein [Candidatus Helarchaeota archaeon]
MAINSAEQAYKKLRDIIMMPKNKFSMDALKIWYNEEDAKILTAGPFRMVMADRYTIEDYAKKSGLLLEKVKETFERLARRGVLFYYVSKRDGKKKFMIPPLFPGLIEYFIINKNLSIDERRNFVKKFHSNKQDALGLLGGISDFSVFRIVPGTKPEPKSRVIEINGNLEPDKSQILAYQDVEEIIKQAGKEEKNIAVVPCTCRTMSMMLKTAPECERTVENCLVFGVPTRYVVDEGIGRYISAEEALDILKQAEKEGLVHLTQNTIDKQGFICNCCTCCCGILSMAVKYNYWDIFQKTDYVPVIDEDKCIKCKKCINICPFYALTYQTGEKEDKSEDKILVREEVCIGCGVCASNCSKDAITLKKVRDVKPAKNFIEAVQRMMIGKKKN